MHRAASLVPKILLGILSLCIFYQVYWLEPEPVALQQSDISKSTWFQDAQKPQSQDVQGSNSPTLSASDVFIPLPPSSSTPSLFVTSALLASSTSASSASSTPTPSLDYSKTHISYGHTQCMPDFDKHWRQQAVIRKESCAKHAPFETKETRRVALSSITTGKKVEAYQRAVQSHMLHAAVHDISAHILCEDLADGAWNKIAFLLHLVQNELLKPKNKRLEWILWIDRDAIIIDPCRPLSSFLPPDTPEYANVNLIVNRDAGDLNAGLFLFKVNEWSANLFSTILGYRYYRPDDKLPSAEQTAMSRLISEPAWAGKVAWVPWYWFNAYPAPNNSIVDFAAGNEPKSLKWFQARKGHFVVHFAGDDGRSARMLEWEDVIETMDVWREGTAKVDVTAEVKRYWDAFRSGALKLWQKTGDPRDKEKEAKEEEARKKEEMMRVKEMEEVQEAKKALELGIVEEATEVRQGERLEVDETANPGGFKRPYEDVADGSNHDDGQLP
ncbi:glycosyltransferase family 34 protein [Bipolaris oryzae ATCC 44560]|uniref:Glycosyltransferase family 34 protein n=1 Tax=Bipolaris oryzae ATCC 44560 TaxID=930090 RepID=W6ZDW8_COCMI|nr:glycosyltransferase family 34 protein [Bipolaris oryzae ATCC 44560]EUC41706.1 glycosyltransferase family 34 protein [Bipolaris oryzae ATCC 44560]